MNKCEYVFVQDKAEVGDIALHLSKCDKLFNPFLSSRVNIDEYAKKIRENAQTYECWLSSDLVGLVAIYQNGKNSVSAYVTNVSICAEHQGNGIANRILSGAVLTLANHGTKKVILEVSEISHKPISLYKKMGFKKKSSNNGIICMELNISDNPKEV